MYRHCARLQIGATIARKHDREAADLQMQRRAISAAAAFRSAHWRVLVAVMMMVVVRMRVVRIVTAVVMRVTGSRSRRGSSGDNSSRRGSGCLGRIGTSAAENLIQFKFR